MFVFPAPDGRPLCSPGLQNLAARINIVMSAHIKSYPDTFVESKTRTSHRRDLDSHEDHTTCRRYPKIVADNYSRRLCERISNGRDYDWLDEHPPSLFDPKLPKETILDVSAEAQNVSYHQVSRSSFGHRFVSGDLEAPVLPWLD